MAKYGIGTNAILEDSEQPREHDRHIMDCCPPGRDQEVFKWPAETGVRWLSQLCDEAGTHLRTETLNRLTSNTSVPNAANGHASAKIMSAILSELTQTDPSSQGSRLKKPLGRWNELVHHRGYVGSFVEFTEPGTEPRLVEVSSTRDHGGSGGSIILGWEFTPTNPPALRRSARRGSTGKKWGRPVPVSITIGPQAQAQVRLAEVSKTQHGGHRPGTSTLGGEQGLHWMEMAERGKIGPQLY